MRTTLELDDELVIRAKIIAKESGETLGRVISDLARKSLTTKAPLIRNGFRVFPARRGGSKIDMEFVNRLRDEE